MTAVERQEMFSKDYLNCADIMKLLGVDKTRAYAIIREIRANYDRLNIEGRVHVQDYIDYYQVSPERYVAIEKRA